LHQHAGGVWSNRCQLPGASNSGYTVYDQNGIVRRFVPNSFSGYTVYNCGGIATRMGGDAVYGPNGPVRRAVSNDDKDY
jgi:hypothetical protein